MVTITFFLVYFVLIDWFCQDLTTSREIGPKGFLKEIFDSWNFWKFWLLSLRKCGARFWKNWKEGKCVSDQTRNSGSHCAATATGNYNNNVEFDVECRRVRTSFCADEMTNTILLLQTFHCKVQQKTLEVISWIRMPKFSLMRNFMGTPRENLIFTLGY